MITESTLMNTKQMLFSNDKKNILLAKNILLNNEFDIELFNNDLESIKQLMFSTNIDNDLLKLLISILKHINNYEEFCEHIIIQSDQFKRNDYIDLITEVNFSYDNFNMDSATGEKLRYSRKKNIPDFNDCYIQECSLKYIIYKEN